MQTTDETTLDTITFMEQAVTLEESRTTPTTGLIPAASSSPHQQAAPTSESVQQYARIKLTLHVFTTALFFLLTIVLVAMGGTSTLEAWMLPLVVVLFFWMRTSGSLWWLPVGGTLFLFSVVLARLAPILIFPLFYKFKPLEEGVFIFDISKNTKKANAAFTGIGKSRRILLGVYSLVTTPLSNMLSRAHEYAADRFAVRLSGKRQAFQHALIKLAKVNLADPSPHPLVEFLFHSHPSIAKRLRAVEGI